MAPVRDWSVFSRLRPAVVICSVEGDPEIIQAAQEAGALGYVLKTQTDRDLITAVKSAAHGKWFVSA
jgi:DNA-binding NarL/FixJ family response regulator